LRLLNQCVEDRSNGANLKWDSLIIRFGGDGEKFSCFQRSVLRADYLSLLFGGEWPCADELLGIEENLVDVHYQVNAMRESHMEACAGNKCVQCKNDINKDIKYCEKCLSGLAKFCSCGAKLVPNSNISLSNLQKGKDRCSKCQRLHKGRNPGVVETGINISIQMIGGDFTTLATGIELQNFVACCVVCDTSFERVEVVESKYAMICQGCIKGELVAQECRKCGSSDHVCILQVRQLTECEEVIWCLVCAKKRLINALTPRMMRVILDGRDISDIKICRCGRFKTPNINCAPHQMKPDGLCMDCQFQGHVRVDYSRRLIKCLKCDRNYDCKIGQNILACPRCFTSLEMGAGGIFRLPMIVEADHTLLDVDHNNLMREYMNYGDDFIDMRDNLCWNRNANLRRAFHFLLRVCDINTSFYGEPLHDFIVKFKFSLKTIPFVFRNIVPWKSKGTRDYFGMVLVFLELEGKGGHVLDDFMGNDLMYRVHLHNSLLGISKTSTLSAISDKPLTTLFFGLYMATDINDYERNLKEKFDQLCSGGLGFFREFVLDVNVLVTTLVRYIEEDRQCFVYFRSLSMILNIMTSVGYVILGVYRLSDLTSEYLFVVTKR